MHSQVFVEKSQQRSLSMSPALSDYKEVSKSQIPITILMENVGELDALIISCKHA